MNRSYAAPPVVEVFCEFQFTPNQPFDITTIGLFYDKIKDDFPIKQPQMGVEMAAKMPRVSDEIQPAEEGFNLTIHQRVQFFRFDKSALVQATPNTLTVNHLTPYTSWDEFKPVILGNFEIFKEIINPKGFKRITLGYINRLDFSGPSTQVKDCFNLYVALPKELSKTPVSLTGSVEIPCEDGKNNLAIMLQSIPPEKPNTSSFVLNLNYYTSTTESAGNIPLNDPAQWLQTAHNAILEGFGYCLTSECKSRLGEIE